MSNLKVVLSENKLAAYIAAAEEAAVLDKRAVEQALQTAGVIYGIKEENVESFA